MISAVLFVRLALPAAAAGITPASLDFDVRAEQIAARCAGAVRAADDALKALASLPASARTFANTPRALDDIRWDLSDSQAVGVFLKYVAVSSAARAAANDCETRLEQFSVDVTSREELFAAVSSYEARKEPLSEEEDRRLLAKELLDFKRGGLLLPPARRAELQTLRKRLVELEASFGRNLNEVKDSLLVEERELDGLPDDYVARLPKEGGRWRVSLDYPDYFPFMANARNAEARRKLEFLFDNRAAKENGPILKEVLALRRRAARLLGYKNHAEYVLEDRMAKDPSTVTTFLSRLEARLKPHGVKELAVLAELERKDGGDGRIDVWDWRYYDNQLRKARFDVDLEVIKGYFPLETVTKGMFSVYEELLGVRFREAAGAPTWHPEVKLYEVADSSSGATVGWFYMDLFPREGKYKHAAAFDLIKGRRLADGTYQAPISAMVANFPKPTAERPALLKHGEHQEVDTYFHEFGHIMHQTLTRAKHGRFSGSSVARDFVEAPSQMLENWVWSPEVLARLSGHYKDGSKLPADLYERMLAAKHVDTGLVHLRQVFFATLDMRYHTADRELDASAEWAKLMARVSLIPMASGTHPDASFGHLMGYDAGYYGYLWSKVYAQDMFSLFEKKGILDPELGRRYRATILEPGRGRDEMASLRAFLGREPGEEAFLKSLGLETR